MSKSILCAVDINRPKEERHVLERAAQIADLDGAQLDIITVVPDFGSSLVGAYLESHHVETARDGAKDALEQFGESVLGVERNSTVRHIVAVGSVYEEVLETAKAAGTDLIVLGAHRPDLRDYLLGPNAARVVRHSECSVYVVRQSG